MSDRPLETVPTDGNKIYVRSLRPTVKFGRQHYIVEL